VQLASKGGDCSRWDETGETADASKKSDYDDRVAQSSVGRRLTLVLDPANSGRNFFGFPACEERS